MGGENSIPTSGDFCIPTDRGFRPGNDPPCPDDVQAVLARSRVADIACHCGGLAEPADGEGAACQSQGLAEPVDEPVDASETSAATHGILRQLVGFDLVQLHAEYRAFRATVLRLWKQEIKAVDATAMEDIARFNEAVDQALAESIASYSERVANSRDTFLAVLGHDLRSPLSAITLSLFALGHPRLQGEERDRTLQLAKRSATAMGQMISDLLEYTRTRLGRGIEVVPASADLATLCRDVLEEIQAAYPDRVFVTSIPSRVATRLDAPRMRQVLTNLLSNAVQHGDPSSPIALTATREGSEARFEVRNRGTPIPPDALQVIFDPLVQIPKDELSNQSNSSLGLGLFIAREIVSAHGGSISVTSTEFDGTSFKVSIPASTNA